MAYESLPESCLKSQYNAYAHVEFLVIYLQMVVSYEDQNVSFYSLSHFLSDRVIMQFHHGTIPKSHALCLYRETHRTVRLVSVVVIRFGPTK